MGEHMQAKIERDQLIEENLHLVKKYAKANMGQVAGMNNMEVYEELYSFGALELVKKVDYWLAHPDIHATYKNNAKNYLSIQMRRRFSAQARSLKLENDRIQTIKILDASDTLNIRGVLFSATEENPVENFIERQEGIAEVRASLNKVSLTRMQTQTIKDVINDSSPNYLGHSSSWYSHSKREAYLKIRHRLWLDKKKCL